MTLTIHDLREQTFISAERNIREVIYRHLDMQFGVFPRNGDDYELDNLDPAQLASLGAVLQKEFPFFPPAFVGRSGTIRDLVYIIIQEAGCSAQQDVVTHRTEDSSLFAGA